MGGRHEGSLRQSWEPCTLAVTEGREIKVPRSWQMAEGRWGPGKGCLFHFGLPRQVNEGWHQPVFPPDLGTGTWRVE